MSRSRIFESLSAAVLACALPAWAQYPGRVTPSAPSSTTQHLRATAVVEYTGTLDHITASRLIPLAIWDGMEYEPGALYLASPAPLAVLGGTQYELESDGKSKGFFNISDSEQIAGLWVGVGRFQAPRMEAKLHPMKHLPRITGGTNGSNPGEPHFAHVPQPDQQTAGQSTGSGTPTLQQRPTDTGSGGSDDSISGNGVQIAPQAQADTDQPTLHRRGSAANPTTANAAPVDPDRPRLSYANPDAKEKGPATLLGMPADMKQIAGVSDSRKLDTESYSFAWSNPADAVKMQSDLEKIAQQALTPPAPASPAAPARNARRHKPAPAPAPPALDNVQFRVFSLTFGGGATMVLSARTQTSPVQYVTIIAQPDFYGNPQVLFKQITSGNTLDAVPRMRLIDAVDTTGNGRGDLIFELRGYTYRQFAIYSIYNGTATRVFVTQPISTPQAIVNPDSTS
jgi:hypothetical protein